MTKRESAMGNVRGLLVILILLCSPLLAVGQAAPDSQPAVQSGWQIFPVPTGTGTMYAISMSSAVGGWAGGMAGAFLQWNGADWSPNASPHDSAITAIDSLAADSVWAVTSAGRILKFDGVSWEIHSTVDAWLDDVAMVGASDGWAVGSSGKILRYNGSTWTEVGSPTSSWLKAVDLLAANDGWAMGAQTILRWAGSGWSVVGSAWPTVFTDVDMVSANDVWAVGGGGAIYHYDGGGWTAVDSPTTRGLRGIDMVDANTGWIVGDNGTILQYVCGAWHEAASPTTKTLNGIAMVGAGDGWITGDLGVMLRYYPPPATSLYLSKQASPAHQYRGGQVTYTILFGNDGATACGVDVTDALPAEVQYVSSNPPAAYNPGAHELAWPDLTLGQGDQIQATVAVIIDPATAPGTVMTNTAYLNWQSQALEATASHDVIPLPANLSSSYKQASDRHAAPGDVLTYTIYLANSGDLVAPSVQVTDAIPADTQYVTGSAHTTQGVIGGPDPLVVTVGDIQPGAEVTITFQVTVGGPISGCWAVYNAAHIGSGGAHLTRATATYVGACSAVYLPVINRQY